MRNRLAAWAALLALTALALGSVLRGEVHDNAFREAASENVVTEADHLAEIVSGRVEAGAVADEVLEGLAGPRLRVSLDDGLTRPEAQGDDFDATDAVRASVSIDAGVLTVEQTPLSSRFAWSADTASSIALIATVCVIVLLLAWLIAGYLSKPYRRLAAAAQALERGRFDVATERFGSPEADVIASALGSAADRMRGRLEREREFAVHASHELRTKLTALRFRCEEMADRDDVPASVGNDLRAELRAVDELTATASELVELSRGGSLVDGAEMPLSDLATWIAQIWTDRLATQDRAVSASVDGALDIGFTPGLVEQLSEELLRDTMDHSRGDVRLRFQGSAEALRLEVRVDEPVPATVPDRAAPAGTTLAESVGGRVDRRSDGSVTAFIPRR